MTYEEAVALHESAKEYGSILGLDSIRNLMQELEDVWKNLKIVHIAGTNGKGSVCCFLASILKEAGYKVGQYNSPAVFDLREVYRIHGVEISKEEYANCMEQVNAACQRLVQQGKAHPTVFEIETAIAFLWFYQQNCDIVLLETGMGGSTDATNLIEQPLCSVLVSVSMDHMGFLGDTIEEIAKIKSGIIKENCPVVTVSQLPEVEKIFRTRAKEMAAEYQQILPVGKTWVEADRLCYEYPATGTIRLSMLGSYQVENSALAIETIRVLETKGYTITTEQLKKGLETAKWQGRFECLCKNPLFYVDGAHNEDGVKRLEESLRMHFPNRKKIGIMGVMSDKSYDAMLELLLPLFEKIYTVTPDNPRALSAELLAEVVSKKGTTAIAENTVAQAVVHACEEAAKIGEDAMVVAFGSLYYLKEVKNALIKDYGGIV